MGFFSRLFGGGQTPKASPARAPTPRPTSSELDKMVDRNQRGSALEKAGRVDAAIKLYELNVSGGFDGTHPYERLMIIYSRLSRARDAKRVAAACLASVPLPGEKVRRRCEKALA